MKKKVYLIDGSSFLYRAYFALPYLSTSKGLPTRVVFGFLKMINKILSDHKPDYISIVFDPKGPTFRHKMLTEYKIKRPPMPNEIITQLPYVNRLLEVMQIHTIVQDGFEADDVIAALSLANKDKYDVIVVTSDKDLYQLTEKGIKIWHPQKERFIDAQTVKEILGVAPSELTDYLALCGDAVDGIPGVKGVGEKTALKLITEFGNLENIYNNIDKLPERLQKLLIEYKNMAFLSRELCKLSIDRIPDVQIEDMSLKPFRKDALFDLLKELEFYDIIKELDVGEMVNMFVPDAETYDKADIKGENVFLLFTQDEMGKEYLLFTENGKKIYKLDKNYSEFFEDIKQKQVFTSDAKKLIKFLIANKIPLFGFHDLSLISYLLNPGANHNHTIEDVFRDYYGFLPDRIQSNKPALFPENEKEKMSIFLLKNFVNLSHTFYAKIKKEKDLFKLYREIELPLSEILARMEIWGVKVDQNHLKEISADLEKRLENIEKEIYKLTDTTFNLNSPKQLASVLYEKLGLKSVKKGKKKLSTAADVLEELYDAHPAVPLILEHRNIAKIKNTYVDVLPSFVQDDGRIHTTFNQTLTATGRLSSSNPNLQNIPIKYEWGEKLRKAFIADDGYFLVAADYSQIEIRILAELSEDENLIEDFRKKRDVHTMTASKIFNIMPELVTKEMRRQAKTINFGILYGMGRYSLSRALNVSVKDAEEFIKRYFKNYPKVAQYREMLIEKARKDKFVTTYFGRKRFIYEIDSLDHNVRQNAERIAMNTPLQGTAADIVKKAMLDVFNALKSRHIVFKILLQIHDELLIEVEDVRVSEAMAVIKEKMEGVVNFRVPLEVKVGVGKNWFDAAK